MSFTYSGFFFSRPAEALATRHKSLKRPPFQKQVITEMKLQNEMKLQQAKASKKTWGEYKALRYILPNGAGFMP